MVTAFALLAAAGDVFSFRPTNDPMLDFITPRRAQQIELIEAKPTSLHRAPKATAARYGVLTLGPKASPTTYVFLIDGKEGEQPRIVVDSNHDGDLTNDPRAKVVRDTVFIDNERKPLFKGSVTVALPATVGERHVPLELAVMPADKAGKRIVNVAILQLMKGKIELGGEQYDATLIDTATSGDYTDPGTEPFGVWLRVDLNRNGRFERRGERFFVAKPFAVSGRTYEAKVLSSDGSKIRIDYSTKHAVETPPPPALREGERLEAFTATTRDGKTIRFPEDFRDKIVLLDVGGSRLPRWNDALPVMGRLRQDMGIEVVEVTLDPPKFRKELDETLKAARVDWPVIIQDKGWLDALPQKYGIVWAPTRLLIDGSTQRLLADGEALDNQHLLQEAAKATGKPIPADLRGYFDLKIPADVKEVALYRELAKRVEKDQAGRYLADLDGFADFMFERWRAADHDNTAYLKRLLEDGWPGKSRIGVSGSNMVWLMIQHADDDKPFQVRALKIMKSAVDQGEASGKDYAYLVDRVLTGQGKKQLYGTQLNIIDNTIQVQPLEDPANVDARRKAVGMGTLRAYLEYCSKLWGYPIKGDK